MKRKRNGRSLVSLLVIVMLVIVASVLLVRITHFNPITGVYTYDPRTDQPSSLILANRPDLVLLDVLTNQINRDETYPPTAVAKVVKIEPIRVEVSTFTDFQAYAFVTTRFYYADGASRVEEFRFQSVSSDGISLPIINGFTYHAFFGRLSQCNILPSEPGKSVCAIGTQ
jgi:hypothetical protein